jgi:hypothetical protein
MNWINAQIPILEVAQRLAIPVRSKKANCPQCGQRRLTFNGSLNLCRCWSCDPKGEWKTVIDLIMCWRGCDAYEAARWAVEQWADVGRVQIEKSENAHGLTKHVYWRYRQIPIPDWSKPSLLELVACPGWREMPSSTQRVLVFLFALAEYEENQIVTISRRELGVRTGISDPNAVVRATREMEAIGLFQIERGIRTSGGYKPSSYRLTWWTARFQQWKMHGYGTNATASNPAPGITTTTTAIPHTIGTSKSVWNSYHRIRLTGRKGVGSRWAMFGLEKKAKEADAKCAIEAIHQGPA